MRVARFSILVAALLVSSAAIGDNKDVARDAYRDGTRLYDLADFAGALEAFKRAYFNYEEPAFLFNIAQCYRQLGNGAEAMRFYKTYLRKVPDAANAEDVRRIIRTLEQSKPAASPRPSSSAPPAAPANAPASTSAPPPLTPVADEPHPAAAALSRDAATLTATAPPRHVPAYKRWWVWTAVGVVVAGAATGLALGLTQGSHEQTLPAVHVP